MPDKPDESATGEGNSCLDISLQSVASHILASDGRGVNLKTRTFSEPGDGEQFTDSYQ